MSLDPNNLLLVIPFGALFLAVSPFVLELHPVIIATLGLWLALVVLITDVGNGTAIFTPIVRAITKPYRPRPFFERIKTRCAL